MESKSKPFPLTSQVCLLWASAFASFSYIFLETHCILHICVCMCLCMYAYIPIWFLNMIIITEYILLHTVLLTEDFIKGISMSLYRKVDMIYI